MIARSLWVLALCATMAHADQPVSTPATLTVPNATADAELAALTNDPLLGKADRISGEEAKGFVTFTFDDGPDPANTPAVVDALVRYNIPATFFIVTRRLKQSAAAREILARQLELGFQVASHSATHPNLRRATAAKLATEIDDSIRTLATIAERPIGLFRAPFGALDKRGRELLRKRGLTEAFWSIDTLDWKAKHAERLRKKIFKMIVDQNGGVVLLHDVKPITARVVADVLDDLEAENCRRLADQRTPIWPVSIHYFLRDKKQPRAIPAHVQQATAAYQRALPARCAARPIAVPAVLAPLVFE